MSTIKENIKNKHEDITSNLSPGGVGEDLANEFGLQATGAIINGIKSVEWRAYMKNFASNKAQLLRLMGKDDDFNTNEWSKRALAYVVSNSVCTIDTATGPDNDWTLNNMNTEMREGLDNSVDNVTGPSGWFDDFVAEEDKP